MESDVVLEDMFERTTTANSNVSIEEEIDEGEGSISGNSKQYFSLITHTVMSCSQQCSKDNTLAGVQEFYTNPPVLV